MTAVILTAIVTTVATMALVRLTPRFVDWWMFGHLDGPPCQGCGRGLRPTNAIVDNGRCGPCRRADAAAAAAEQAAPWDRL